jgi:hypothetical protein
MVPMDFQRPRGPSVKDIAETFTEYSGAKPLVLTMLIER